MRLCEALRKHIEEDYYPAHMPGHKGNPEYSFLGSILKYDITEIDGLDNLHDAHGVIQESERFAADLYGAFETHFLVNGSTVGVLSAILGVTDFGDRILIGRNCHRSVYNAVQLNNLDVYYIYPGLIDGTGISYGITAYEVEEALRETQGIKAVVITSPTYEGISSDIEGIAAAVHKHGAVLIVDAAHGAHFGFREGFPESAVSLGADIVINSVHKTLPAPTQTALLHISDNSRVMAYAEKIRKQLGIYQSTSPSYLLMAGIDNCMDIIAEHGKELFDRYLDNLEWFEAATEGLKHLRVIGRKQLRELYGIENADPCKIILSFRDSVNSEEELGRYDYGGIKEKDIHDTVKESEAEFLEMPAEKSEITQECKIKQKSSLMAAEDFDGQKLYDILRTEYHIQPEMAADSYCLIIMTVMDKREGFERLKNALKCIDEKIDVADFHINDKEENGLNVILYGSRPAKHMNVSEASAKRAEYARLSDASGRISADYIYLYPPGIPILVPGEEISSEMAGAINNAMDRGLKVQGITCDKEIKVHG